MKFLLVAWIAWTCPGGALLAQVWPARLRPMICAPKAAYELYDPARASAARARVVFLGESATIYACHGMRCSPPLASWTTNVTFKEIP